MSRARDIEDIENFIIALIQENLPAKIAAINAEKGDSLLEDIPSQNYLEDFFSSELTQSRFVHYGSWPLETDNITYDFAENWAMFIDVYLLIENNADSARKIVLRYTRAFREIIKENMDKITSLCCSVDGVVALTPERGQKEDNDAIYQRSGIITNFILS